MLDQIRTQDFPLNMGQVDQTEHARKLPVGVWQVYGALILGAIALTLGVFWETAVSIVSIWWRSETFAHGFLIIPISLYLIWTRRKQLARLEPNPSLWGSAALLVIGFGWLLAHLADVQVIEQLALVAMIPALVIGILGWRVAKEMAFPLAYLIFAVPMGEALIPPMMDFTALFTVKSLQLTGIPVYWEGTFFSIPSGDWSVVEGCSGVRYLIASLALGSLYAYLSYNSYWRRAAFIGLAIIFPIIANGLRAYMIVMIAHLSDMTLALGVDHFVYGWVFFGLVMLLMFWIGSFWREDQADDSADDSRPVRRTGSFVGIKPVTTVLLSALFIPIWPAAAYYLNSSIDADSAQIAIDDLTLGGDWIGQDAPIADWAPRYVGMDAEMHRTYAREGKKVGLYLAYYDRQGGELINSQNVMVEQKHPVWQKPTESRRPVVGIESVDEVYQAQLRSPQHKLLAWHWYWIAGQHTANPYWGKLLQAYAKLTGWHTHSVGVVVYTPYDIRTEDAEQVLQEFLHDALPALEAALQQQTADAG